MSTKPKSAAKAAPPPTVITLTLPDEEREARSGTLLIQRGDLAHVRQFVYTGVSDITAAIKAAYLALAAIEAEPPVVPDLPKASPPSAANGKAAKAVSEKAEPAEPMIEVPLQKGSVVEVKRSHLRIMGGESDAETHRQGVQIAGRLINGKLWDGTSPIWIDDVVVAQRKLKHLTDRELSLFTLEDFVRVRDADTPDALHVGEGATAVAALADPVRDQPHLI